MGMHRVATTQITGLSNSGQIDGSGSWNTADMDTFVTVPSGSTAAVIIAVNNAGSLRWLGAKVTGDTQPVVQGDITAYSLMTWIVPLASGNTIDLYAEDATTGLFYVTGFCDDTWTFYDQDSAPTFAITTPIANVAPTGATIPANATVVCAGLRNTWRPVGESTDHNVGTTSIYNTALVKLDVNSEIYAYFTAAVNILGYTTSGVTWATWMSSAESLTTDTTWRTGPSSNSGKAFGYLIAATTPNAAGLQVRAGDDTLAWTNPTNSAGEGRFLPLDSSGQYDYIGEATTHPTYYVAAVFDTATVTDTRIPRSMLLGVG